MKTYSIRFKTSVLYSGILCVILVVFGMYLFHTVRHILYDETQEDLRVKAGQIEVFLNAYSTISSNDNSPVSSMKQFLSAGGESVTDKELINQFWIQDSRSLGLRKDFFRILSSKGHVLLRSENMTDGMERTFNAQFLLDTVTTRFVQLKSDKIDFYGISYPFRFSDHNTFTLQLVVPLTSVDRILSKLMVFIIGGIVTILLMTLYIGSFLTQRILKPVMDVTMVANNISKKNLNMRIPEQKLDQEMEQLVASFNDMIDRLEHSFTHINEFSSHVAHELKTPLAIITSEIDLASDEGNTKVDNKRIMKVIRGEVERLNKTINDLLFLAKIEYKLNIFEIKEINVAEFLRDIYQDSKILAAQKNIDLTLEESEGRVLIMGDVVHLRRILFNLIHNAVKFTPSKGEIAILAEVHEKQLFISIKDTGIGIALADQPRIFEKFYRIRRLDKEDVSGNGLGLSMARAVARGHGGDIIFKSEAGKGSIFTLILPIKDR